MRRFHNLKISAKMIIGFLVVALLAGVVGGVGLIGITSMREANTALYEENTLGIQYAQGATATYHRLRYNIAEMIVGEDVSLKDEYIEKFNTFIADIDANLKLYEEGIISPEDRAIYEDLQPLWQRYKTYMQEASRFALGAQYDNMKRMLLGDADAVGTALQNTMESLVAYNNNQAQNNALANTAAARNTTLLMIGVIIVAMLVAIVLGSYIARTISRPIVKMVDTANRLAEGDVNVSVEVDTDDEVGTLAKAFAYMIENIRNQALAAERISAGDLTIDIAVRSENDLLNIKMRDLVEKNNQALLSIASASDQVASGARQISDSSVALSQGATEQASSLEQLTASIEEISAQTKQNASYADQANDLAEAAKVNAAEGNDQMGQMLQAMQDINESSSNISKVIKVIDEIAFQTNILALNAAVEAARAGQHGKGFAVVAEEVRNLAGRSADAARETTDMIESSIQKAEGGTKIARQTAGALNKIVEGIEKVASLVGNIAVASNEQAAGISQINQGIMQVSHVVQTNSATSEEGAAASEELSGQAELLKEQVSRYKLKRQAQGSPEDHPGEAAREALHTLDATGGGHHPEQDEEAEDYLPVAAAKHPKKIILSDHEFGKY